MHLAQSSLGIKGGRAPPDGHSPRGGFAVAIASVSPAARRAPEDQIARMGQARNLLYVLAGVCLFLRPDLGE